MKASLAIALVWAVYLLRGNIYFRFYPAVMCAVALAAFVVSSFKTPIVEKIARRNGESLDADAVGYCRKVNNCWILFLSVHLVASTATVLAPIGVWAFYNGFLAYVFFAVMFAGEWLVRRKVRGRRK